MSETTVLESQVAGTEIAEIYKQSFTAIESAMRALDSSVRLLGAAIEHGAPGPLPAIPEPAALREQPDPEPAKAPAPAPKAKAAKAKTPEPEPEPEAAPDEAPAMEAGDLQKILVAHAKKHGRTKTLELIQGVQEGAEQIRDIDPANYSRIAEIVKKAT